MEVADEHVGPVVKNALRAVAVVVVDIKNGNAGRTGVAQGLGRHGCVVQKAVTTHEVGASVMARRAAAAKRGALAGMACRHQGSREARDPQKSGAQGVRPQ